MNSQNFSPQFLHFQLPPLTARISFLVRAFIRCLLVPVTGHIYNDDEPKLCGIVALLNPIDFFSLYGLTQYYHKDLWISSIFINFAVIYDLVIYAFISFPSIQFKKDKTV